LERKSDTETVWRGRGGEKRESFLEKGRRGKERERERSR
jgi:hypothetical protein